MQSAQDDTQTIIGEFYRAKGLPDDGLQCMLMAHGPILDTDLAVVAFGEDESQPDTGQPAVGDPLVQMMTAQGSFHSFRQMKLLHQTKQQGNIIYALMLQNECAEYHTSYATKFGLGGSTFRERTDSCPGFTLFPFHAFHCISVPNWVVAEA